MPDEGGAEAFRSQGAPAFPRGLSPSPAASPAGAAPQAAGANAIDLRDLPVASPDPVVTYSGAWAVQVGSFSARANAERLSDWCREQGFGAQVLAPPEGEQALYRVRVGPYASRDDARSAMAELALLGRSGFVSDWPDKGVTPGGLKP